MLKKTLQVIQSNLLILKLKQTIVIRYQRKRSIFDRTNLNPYWIPKQRTYHKQRKPPQPEWTDPNIIYPQLIPPLYPKCSPQHYIKNVIEAQQKQKALRKKQYIMQDIRAGDLVDITYQSTFQSDHKVTYRALVMGIRRRNSLTASLQVCIRLGGMNLKSIYLIHSPKVINIRLISMGSGNFRSNIKHDWQKLTRSQLSNAKLRKRAMKSRKGHSKRKVKKFTRPSIKFDKTETDSIKRVIQKKL